MYESINEFLAISYSMWRLIKAKSAYWMHFNSVCGLYKHEITIIFWKLDYK